MSHTMSYDVFISHNRKDKVWVRDFVRLLRSQGLKVFFDEDDIPYGTVITSGIETALAESRHVLFVISPNSIKSSWVALETSITIYSDQAAQGQRLIPLILEHTSKDQITPAIRRLNMVDLTIPETRDASLRRLLKQIGIEQADSLELPEWPLTVIEDNKPVDAILVIGSGVAEHVLTVDKDVRLGEKHIVRQYELFGGSGLNYAFRLTTAGHPVIPILSVGKDFIGHKIQKEISKVARENGGLKFIDYIESENFLCDKLTTPQSTIVVSLDKRTIFTETMQGAEHFKDFALECINRLLGLKQVVIKAVMIGHIYADSPRLNRSDAGAITKEVINRFRDKAMIFANFGESQFSLGCSFWKDFIKDVTVFQLSLTEVREFFSKNGKTPSLQEILNWFASNGITVVITLDKFGAISVFNQSKKRVIFGWPFELENIVDSTGAGDAFGAGLVAMLYREQSIGFQQFLNAIERARIWAAYACTTIGGAKDCPNNRVLQEFESQIKEQEFAPVEVHQFSGVEAILRVLDKAY